MTSAILSALNVLTKPLGEAYARDAQSSQRDALLGAMQTNRDLLLKQLQSDKSLEEVRNLRDEERARAAWLSRNTGDVAWDFVQECFFLLLALSRHLSIQVELFGQTLPSPVAKHCTPEMAPPLPPDVLSVTQQKTLTAALQFVVSLGLCPYLVPGVGVALGRRTTFSSLVEGLSGCGTATVPPAELRLLTTTRVLLQLTQLSSLATLVFTRHLGDIMAALCQLGYQPKRSDGEMELNVEDRTACREALKGLLGRVYQPIVIKELLFLQGGPKKVYPGAGASGAPNRQIVRGAPAWLRHLCGQLLSERLMQPNGIQSVVRAILEGGTGGDSDWRKCESVARILVACPQRCVSADSYYRQVCPQVLELLHFKDKLTAQQFQHVATKALITIVEEKPEFGRWYLLDPLLRPLQRCTIATGEDNPEASVEEWELTRCVEDVYKIWVVGNSPSAPLLKALDQVLPVIFTLFCFTKQNVSHLRTPCQEVLLWYLGHAERAEIFVTLSRLSSTGGQPYWVTSELHFSPGSEGGAKVTPREPVSDEDDAMYERLSGEQWRLECLVQLLAELKDSDLPGDFFLKLLQELTNWNADDEEEVEEQDVDLRAMSLLEVEQHLSDRAAVGGQRIALLQALAALCQGLPHATLLRKTTQVVDFVISLLQRACVGLTMSPGPSTENPVESQTLSMAMGLVATLLSEPQLSAEDYASMSRLLDPLEEISQKHPEVLIQGLALDLRAVIATHGAYRPETLAASDQCRRAERVPRSSREPSRNKPNTRPPAEDSNPPQVGSRPSTPCAATGSNGTRASTANTGSRPSEGTGDPLTQRSSSSQMGPLAHGKEAPAPKRGVSGGERGPGASADPGCFAAKALSDLLLEACDPDVPTRAVALRMLTRMVHERDSQAAQSQETILLLFLENLKHNDSFVYLSAIQGLAVLADSFPDRILERLIGEFKNPSLPNKEHSLETRLKVGEVLMRASRAMGELAPHLGRPLIAVFLQGTLDEDASVRASCLSNLGELCQRLDYALGPLAQELSCCLSALIKTEKEAEVRRAAVHVITLLLRGLGDKATQVLGEVLLDLYRALKWALRTDRDEVAVLHTQLALEELDHVMKRFVFPEQKLEKKIVVLP